MKLYEIEEAHEIIKSINSLLLAFTASKKTNGMVRDYLVELISDLEEQGSLVEDEEGNPIEIDIAAQISFLKYTVDVMDELTSSDETNAGPDKSAN